MVFYKSVLFNGVFLISDGDLIIELTKAEAGIWSQLGRYPKKNEAKEFREKAEEDFRNFYNKDLESRKTNKAERDRKSVNLCIEKDERKRDNIDEIKNTIVGSLGDKNPTVRDENIKPMKEDETVNINKTKVDKTINKITSRYSIDLAKRIAAEDESLKRSEAIPPRNFTTIDVKFTPRQFVNPARESKKEEEEEWLRKQAKAKDRKAKIKEELQMDHDEIVKKCQSFFHSGDLESAEEILTHGIELFPKSSQLLNNRIAVRLRLEKYFEALMDSEKSLELMIPEVEGNKKARAAVRCRRAFALRHLDRDVEALIELEEAVKICPNDEKIAADLESLRNVINSNDVNQL